MTNNRKMDCVISGKGLKFNFDLKADEILVKQTSKKFGEDAKYNKTVFEGKNINLSFSTSEDEFQLDLNVFFEGLKEAINKASKPIPVSAPEKEVAPVPEKDTPTQDIRIAYFEENLRADELQKINSIVSDVEKGIANYLTKEEIKDRVFGLTPKALYYLEVLINRTIKKDSKYESKYPEIHIKEYEDASMDRRVSKIMRVIQPV